MNEVGKAGYKKTEIDRVPADWKVTTLEKLADIDSESLSNKTSPDFEFRYISLGDVNRGVLSAGNQYIKFSGAPSRARRIIKSGDILFSTVRPNLKGHCFARKVEGSVIASTGFAVIRAKQESSSAEYLYHFLMSIKADEQIEKLTAGSNYPAVNSSDVKALKVGYPPLLEQQKIAAILTTADDILDVLARRIANAKSLKQGLIQTLLRQGVGIQGVSEWTTVSLHEVAEVRTGVAKGKKGLKEPILLPYLRVANVQDGYIDLGEVKTIEVEASQVQRYSLQAGDVLLTEGGDFDKLGRGDVWDGRIAPCLHQNHVFAVRPNPEKLDSYYLAALTASYYGRLYFLSCAKRTTNLASINSSQLKAFPVLLPPLAEQQAIAEILKCVDAELYNHMATERHYKTLKRGLMRKLLTGEWRVTLDEVAIAA